MTTYKAQVLSNAALPPLAAACAVVAKRAYPVGAAWHLTGFQQDMAAAHRLYAVVRVEGQLLAYVGAIRVLDQVDITGVAVDPNYQRIGLAKKLMAALFAKLTAGTDVFLEVRAANWPARNLYCQVGFKPIGVRKDYYEHPDEDAVLMKLSI
ncbi:ribosomal protein S18-alanine N-acetyltransferase [Secundilactobacillus folii]|uniref:[Ribosomal protein bS18]-alanine N-acetyltransferase n=1 Tax=Secundilactobacillus folii TaxID=2678357 RepID=A0A7X2XVI7_9LACO|nr:ribosomal protein S18-alanine N-acetyltransferase [Secundilactobacillus folii]MTV82404.1 ribosomal-protein-alanine N-acetyltransferase [Secundilactobacillus folii]